MYSVGRNFQALGRKLSFVPTELYMFDFRQHYTRFLFTLYRYQSKRSEFIFQCDIHVYMYLNEKLSSTNLLNASTAGNSIENSQDTDNLYEITFNT